MRVSEVGAGSRIGLMLATVLAASALAGLDRRAAAQEGVALAEQSAPARSPPATASPRPAEIDPAALKASIVLETHCARCHQHGKLEGLLPSGSLANVTRLDEIAREPGLVEPQHPDASRLYLQLVERRMPRDAFHEGQRATEPTADEIQNLRDWISGLPLRPDACDGRTFISPAATQSAIKSALEAEGEAAKSTRFLTLTHLYNACIPDAEIAAYRQAAAKLMNSLAWSQEPARLEPIDGQQTILKLKLPDLGWGAAHWEKLTRAFPYPAVPALSMPAEVGEMTGTHRPALPADWIAAAATHPQLYADLLGLPAGIDDLMKALGLDIADSIRSGKAARAAISRSQVTRGQRLVETHPLATGGRLWLAYELAGTADDRDIFKRPLGPGGTLGATEPFRHDIVRLMFSLPNGFLAYAVYDAGGKRLDVVPAGLEKLEAVGYAASRSGSSCVACHTSGPFAVKDELRARLQSAGAKDLLQALAGVLRNEDELKTLFDEEVQRFRSAMGRSGSEPELRILGLEPVTALRQSYERNVSLARAAAEFGSQPAEFRATLAAHSGPARELALRLQQGVLRRPELATLLAGLMGEAAPSGPLTPAADAAVPGPVDLVLLADRGTYKVGDLATFTARASADCRLTLISVNKAGKGIVLFPNEFEQDNLLTGEREVRVPGPKAPYQLRLKERGSETLIGVCTQSAKVADGIQPDYEKQRFTILGDWRNFIHSALEEEAAERLNPERDKDNKRKRRTRARSEPSEPPRPRTPDVQTRAAIRYTVE